MSCDLSILPESLPDGAVRLRLAGTLNGGAAYELRDHIIGVLGVRSNRVVVDFSRLTKLSDFGLGILAMGIAELDGSALELVGLGHHAQRILKAFGVAAAA